MPALAARPRAFPASFAFPAPRPAAAGTGLRNGLEGIGNGTTVTTGNSGGASGNAFDGVTASNGTVTADTSVAAHGTTSLKLVTTTTAGNAYVSWSTSAVPGIGIPAWAGWGFYADTLPTANFRIWSANSGAAICGSVTLLTTGALRLLSSSGGTLATTTALLSATTWYRVEVYFAGGTSGTFALRLYTAIDAASGSYTEQISASGAALNAPASTWRFGFSASGITYTAHWDDLALSTTAWTGPQISTFTIPADPSAGTSDPGVFTDGGETTGITSADTGSGAEAQQIAVSSSDTGSFTENTPATGITSADSATAAENTPSTGVISADTGSFTENTPSTGISSADTATAAELTGPPQVQGADSAVFTENTPSTGISSADTATAAEAFSTGITSADSATAAENTPSITLASADTGSFTDTGSVGGGGTPVSDSDTGTFTENTPSTGISSADSGSFTDTAAAPRFAAADAGTLTENPPSIALSATDAASGAENLPAIGTASADAAAGAEGPPAAGIASADTGSFTESIPGLVLQAADTGTATEAAQLAVADSDAATAAEALTLAVVDSDSATATEDGFFSGPVFGADSGVFTDAQNQPATVIVVVSASATVEAGVLAAPSPFVAPPEVVVIP